MPLRPDLWLLAETSLPHILDAIDASQPELVVIDCIQTVADPALGSPPGSVGQVRGCAQHLVNEAKAAACRSCSSATSPRRVAWPDHGCSNTSSTPCCRSRASATTRCACCGPSKHRFGPTNELGLFEMAGAGLIGVPDPSIAVPRRSPHRGPRIGGRAHDGGPATAARRGAGARDAVLAGVPPRRSALRASTAPGCRCCSPCSRRRAGSRSADQDVYASTVGGVQLSEPGLDLGGLPRRGERDPRPAAARRPRRVRRGRPRRRAPPGRPGPAPTHRGGTARLRRVVVPSNSPDCDADIEVIRAATLSEAIAAAGLGVHSAPSGLRRRDESAELSGWIRRCSSRIRPCTPDTAASTRRCATRSPVSRRARRCATASIASCGRRPARSSCSSDDADVLSICSGGFLVDAPYSPQRLSELAKMDGAIILSTDGGRIARANVHLVPDPSVPTSETGTRHRTAERVARSLDVPVVSASEEMGVDQRLRRRQQAPAPGDRAPARPGQPGAADARALQGAPRRRDHQPDRRRGRRRRHAARCRRRHPARRDGPPHRRRDRDDDHRARRRRSAAAAAARRAVRRDRRRTRPRRRRLPARRPLGDRHARCDVPPVRRRGVEPAAHRRCSVTRPRLHRPRPGGRSEGHAPAAPCQPAPVGDRHRRRRPLRRARQAAARHRRRPDDRRRRRRADRTSDHATRSAE